MIGRPSIYSEELADRICQGLMNGESLIKVCLAKGMPDRVTVIRWIGRDLAFATRIAHAREAQADYMDDLILDTAAMATSENANAIKVKIDAYKWRASKLAPKKYGDKMDVGFTGVIQTMPKEALDARITELLGKAGVAAAARGVGTEEGEE
jgi:hypothetical protein